MIVIENKSFNLTQSPMWNYTKNIWEIISGKAIDSPWSDRWFETIVWTDLYKVAPCFGGNPDDNLKKTQFDACAKLLIAEINYFKPTHILFMTGYKDWFDKFDEFKMHGKPIFNLEKTDDNCKFVEAKGVRTFKGEDAKIVVATRPETKKKAEYTKEVASAFK